MMLAQPDNGIKCAILLMFISQQVTPMTTLSPVHPGEVLNRDFMRPSDLSIDALAKAIGVPDSRISDIVNGQEGVTADMASRLAQHFNTDAQSWMILQSRYEAAQAACEGA